MNRQEVLEKYAQGKDLHGVDLSGVDLSEVDLSGVDLHEANFLADGSTFTTVDFPSAISFNIAWNIDNAGQIVGDYKLVPGVRHGFLATPVPRQKPPQ